jgi:hypothetical protein
MSVHILTGRVLPERATINIGQLRFQIVETSDVSQGDLSVEIVHSQVFAKFTTAGAVANIFTLRNIVESTVRALLDIVGYVHGYGYDADIVQYIPPEEAGTSSYVFGINIPAIADSCAQAGVSVNDVLAVMAKPNGYYVRQALADVREAIKSPTNTAFFCYRAIESLKNGYGRNHDKPATPDATWEQFRNQYALSKDAIMQIKSFADPIRHGNYADEPTISDSDRATIFKNTWDVINHYITGEMDSAPVGTPGE